uniref:Uncharacterized protein n=1 Tax=Aegilops tauschii subsp. strangulata TaxID=200361 RepID=A0A453IRK5_AEGTS
FTKIRFIISSCRKALPLVDLCGFIKLYVLFYCLQCHGW